MSIKITGLEDIQTKLDTLSQELKPPQMKKKMANVGLRVKTRIIESFNDEKSPFGEPWTPLKESTKKQKAKHGKSSKILKQDGYLSQKSRWVVSSNPNKVTISNNISAKGFPYGLSHQFGSSKRNIPRRPFLPIDSSNNLESGLTSDIVDFLEDEIVKVLK